MHQPVEVRGDGRCIAEHTRPACRIAGWCDASSLALPFVTDIRAAVRDIWPGFGPAAPRRHARRTAA